MAPDIIQMQNRSFIATMIIDGEKMPAFSGNTLMMPKSQDSHVPAIIEHARANFTKPREEVEAMIRANAETTPLQKGQVAAPVQQVQQPQNAPLGPVQPGNPAASLLGLTGVAPATNNNQNGEEPKKKRKRIRSRRKKNNDNQA